MADSPPVTRKRGKQNDGDRTSARDRRYAYNDWRDAVESERVVIDKRKKLLRSIPTSIPGVSGVMKGQAKRDIREMGACVDMKVVDTDEVVPGGVMVTPRPLIPKTNRLEAKRARLARWQEDPSLIAKDMAEQREAVSRAEEKDAMVEAEQEAWERWYLSLRAHLMARRRPTVSWSRTAEATASSDLSSPASSVNASTETPASAAGEIEVALEEANGRASAFNGGDDPDGGNGNGSQSREGKGEGDVKGTGAAGRGVAVWSCWGEEEEEEASMRELEQVVMKRAGLKGEFDMKKVIDVHTDRGRQVMSARREHVALLAEQQQQQHSQKNTGKDEVKADGDLDAAHPGDVALLRRWEELLRSTGGGGRRAPNGINEAFHVGLGSQESILKTKSASLLIPRGLDLPPSMRTPRYPALLLQQRQEQNQQQQKATIAGETSRNSSSAIDIEIDGSKNKGGAMLALAERTARAMECMPCIRIGGCGGVGVAGVQGVPTVEAEAVVVTGNPAIAQAAASMKGCIGDRVQWFPRGLPMEMAKPEGGYDELESAQYAAKISQAVYRLKGLMEETDKMQGEMELRRQQKAKEAVGLVRAVAQHEKLRQAHLKRMKDLKKQLKKLERARERSSTSFSAANESSGDGCRGAGASEEPSPMVDEGDQFNPASSSKASSVTATTDAIAGDVSATNAPGASDAASSPTVGVTMATTRSRSPSSPVAVVTLPHTPTSPSGKGAGKGKGREADAKGRESPSGHQQHDQVVRGGRREEDATSTTSSTSPLCSPSPCSSSSSGLEKTSVATALRESVMTPSSDRGGDSEDDRGGERGGDGEKVENIASNAEDMPVEDAARSRKRALGGEAGGGVALRAASKRRRSADVVMALSVNDDSGTGRNPSVENGETPDASLLSTRNAAGQASAAAGSKGKSNDTATTPSSGGGSKSKYKAVTSGKRVSSARLGSRGRWGGRR